MRFVTLWMRFAAALLLVSSLAAQAYTPTSYKITLYEVALSTDGNTWTVVLDDDSGVVVDLADPNAFANAIGTSVSIAAGTYKWIRMVLGKNLVWSYPSAPVNKTDQTFTVPQGPAGPDPNKLSVHFATHDQGGKPMLGQGAGGDGTQTRPFLLGAPAKVEAGGSTTLRIVFVITDALRDQGGGNYDLAPPQMFFVSENGSASSLSGTFNTVLYNGIKKEDDNTVEKWSYHSGYGTLTFDGSGNWTWSGTMNNFDLKNGATGSLNTSSTLTGRYGVNEDGSFWLLANGEPGTIQGAISSDGKIMVASMYDSSTSHMMLFGVKQATGANISSMNSGYYFTHYGSSYDNSASRLRYESSFGIVTADGSGVVNGTSQNNYLDITNVLTSPTISGPNSNLNGSFNDTMSVTANGVLSNANGNLKGGFLEGGDAVCLAWNFGSPYQSENRFGFLVRQSPANTFTNASLQGTYFGGHFGDMLEPGNSVSYFSGFFKIVFDGQGNATVTTVENLEGRVEANTFPQVYSVDPSTGVVSFRDPGTSSPAIIKGAIGPGAGSFILTAVPELSGQPATQRFLGLGLKQ